jgi:hypothetical protein
MGWESVAPTTDHCERVAVPDQVPDIPQSDPINKTALFAGLKILASHLH